MDFCAGSFHLWGIMDNVRILKKLWKMAVHGVSAYNEEGGRRRRKRMEKVERWIIMMNNVQIITHHHYKMIMIWDSQVKYCNFENAAIFLNSLNPGPFLIVRKSMKFLGVKFPFFYLTWCTKIYKELWTYRDLKRLWLVIVSIFLVITIIIIFTIMIITIILTIITLILMIIITLEWGTRVGAAGAALMSQAEGIQAPGPGYVV